MPRLAARPSPARRVGHVTRIVAVAALALVLGSPAAAAPERPPAAPDPSPSSPGAPATTPGSSGTNGPQPSGEAGTADPRPDPTGPPGSAGPTLPLTSTPEVEPEPVPDPEPGEGASETVDPLQVSIQSLEPSVLPDSGEVTLRGSVTNRSPDPWTELAVYAATSATAITTPEQLREAEDGPPGVEPADYQRIIEPGLFELVGDLGPGESTDFTVRLPRSRLGIPRTPGVYRLGVQVLGTEPQGRVDGADGRDRLLTVVGPRTGPRTPISVALQVRRRTTRTPTGQVDDPEGWQRVLAPEGRLRHLLDLLASARRYPVDAVVDPAVVEAVGSIAAGNPPFDLTAQEVPGVQQVEAPASEPGESPDATESPGESESSQGESETTDDSDSAAGVATQWLRRLSLVSDRLAIGALPYGDLDLAAAVRQDRPELVGESLSSGISLLSEFGVQATGLLSPIDGTLVEPAALAAPQGVPGLVSEDSLVQAVVGPDGIQVLDTPAGEVPAALEGPSGAPLWTYRSLSRAGPDGGALALRQRILARSAVSALTRPGAAVVAVLPPQWRPGADWRAARFFAGLREADWLAARHLDELEPRGPEMVTADSADTTGTAGSYGSTQAEPTSALAFPAPSERAGREVPGAVFEAADEVVRTGEVLGDLVVDGARLVPVVSRQAMLGRSVHSRGRTPATVGRLQATSNVLGALVRDVEVQAPRFVRMSSEEGSFLVPVVNQLDVAVQVQLLPRVAEPGLSLEVAEPVVVGPGARRPIRVEATSSSIGIRSVQLDLATVSGQRLYPGPSLAIRSSQVARWVWVAMAIGSGILFLTILVRIVRRIRHRSQPLPRSVSGPAPDPVPDPEEAR